MSDADRLAELEERVERLEEYVARSEDTRKKLAGLLQRFQDDIRQIR